MKKHSAEFPGPLGWRMRTSNTFPRSPSPERGIQIYGLCRIVFPALFLLIFSLAVLGGTASSAEEGATNTFYGLEAGDVTTGGFNSFFGASAGEANTTGLSNSFAGYYAGNDNISGYENSFFGAWAGSYNVTGYDNSFFGHHAGRFTSSGIRNAFVGAYAGLGNTTGGYNSFIGESAGSENSTGSRNTFVGRQSGQHHTVENNNTLVGAHADLDPGADPAGNPVTNATAIGYRSYVAQSNSLVLGSIYAVNGAAASVNVGIGTPAPERQLHLKGDNACFRMDRNADTAAFILVRTDGSGNPLKSFVVGANASGSNTGEFVINDLGTAVGGPGNRRMTITNVGNVTFAGTVTAPAFFPTSSLAFKTHVRTYENALDTVNRLRGVRFDWKESGTPSVGLIAEEVEGVVPEVILHDGGTARGINYDSLVGVLVEALKEEATHREKAVKEQRTELESLNAKMNQQQEVISRLINEISELKNRDMIARRN